MAHPTRGRALTTERGAPTRERLTGRELVPGGLDATLVLLRHGESTAIAEGRFQGQSQVPLSPLGREQAARAAARLARPHDPPDLPVPIGPPVEIVHSPLARTLETAQAVAGAVGGQLDDAVPLRPEPGLREIGQGEWEGRLATEIGEQWADVLDAWRRRPAEAHAPGGEALADVAARVRPALAGVLGRLAQSDRAPRPHSVRSGPVLAAPGVASDHPWSIVVGHDGVFKVLLLTLFELPLDRFWLFPFTLCGISVVEIADGRPRLRAHNLTEHLAPLLERRSQQVTEARERSGAL